MAAPRIGELPADLFKVEEVKQTPDALTRRIEEVLAANEHRPRSQMLKREDETEDTMKSTR